MSQADFAELVEALKTENADLRQRLRAVARFLDDCGQLDVEIGASFQTQRLAALKQARVKEEPCG